MPARSYCIVAGTLYGNRGAQAMVETAVAGIRRADASAQVHVFSYYPDDDRRVLTDPRVHVHSLTPATIVLRLLPFALLFGTVRRLTGRVPRWAPRDIRALGCATAVVDVAGVAFIDGRERFLPFNVLSVAPALLLRTPVVKMPQAMGPLRGRATLVAARLVLPRCAAVWARGDRTLQHLEAAGLAGTHVDVADDIAFLHESGDSLTDERPDAALLAEMAEARAQGRTVVGVCPSSVLAVRSGPGGHYEPLMADMVRRLTADGHLVVLFPNACRAAGSGERNNDLPLIGRVAAAVGSPPTLRVVTTDLSAAAVRELIAACDVVLVSRFHAMVAALASHVPPLVIGWSHKYAEVMERFGLERFVTPSEESTPDRTALLLGEVLDDVDGLRVAIEGALPAVRASSARPLAALASLTSTAARRR